MLGSLARHPEALGGTCEALAAQTLQKAAPHSRHISSHLDRLSRYGRRTSSFSPQVAGLHATNEKKMVMLSPGKALRLNLLLFSGSFPWLRLR